MNRTSIALALAALVGVSTAEAQTAAPQAAPAQPKPTVSGFLAEGYQVVHTDIGSPFIQFVLQKGTTLVWCSVLLQSGETSSCRTIK